MKTDILEKMFRWVSDTINNGERAVLDALSAIVPYTTASIPSYLTYVHTFTYMAFPERVAWMAAFTVEVLGVTAVSTAIRFWQWNKTHIQEKDRAPFWLATATYGFYIAIVLSVNVILEIYAKERAPAVIWAIGLFSMLSVPSGILISIRAQHGEMLEGKREQAEQRRTARMQPAYNKDIPQPKLEEDQPNSGGKFRAK
jgi:hypothetical protein